MILMKVILLCHFPGPDVYWRVERTIMMLTIRSGATLAILVLLALAGGLARPATAGAPAVGITYEDGTLSITTTADRTGILRAGGVHFDPPKPVDAVIFIGGITLFSEYRVSSVSETELRGTVTRGSCIPNYPCVPGPPESFLLRGPVDTPPRPSDMLFVGTFDSGGTITVSMRAGDVVTAFILEDAPPNCPLNIHAFDFFSGDPVVLVERGVGNYVNLYLTEVERPDDRTLTGKIGFCGEFSWTAELVVGPTTTPPPVTPTPPPPTSSAVAPTSAPAAAATPAPTSAVLASQLPSAGAPPDDASSILPAVIAIAGALLLGGGLFAARRRA